MSPEKPLVQVAIAIVLKAPLLLVCQRFPKEPFPSYWEFPGGKLHANESPADCLARELREELDILAPITEALPPIEHDYPKIRVRLHPFLCELATDSPPPKAIACQQFRWIMPQELSQYSFPEANAPLLEMLIRRLTGQSTPPPYNAASDK